MPGTLLYAAPSAVFPYGLYTNFGWSDAWPTVQGDYADGTRQVRADGVNPRHSWTVAQRRTYAQWSSLKAFWVSMRGGLTPFYFYPNPAQYDATGVSTIGRYTVRFEGELAATYDNPRWPVQLKLVEVA
jgi:phage-related protein